MLQNAEAAAKTFGVEVLLVQVRGAGDLESAFATMTASRAEALLVVLPCPLSNAERQRIADHAIRHRLPSTAWTREFVETGCLLAYGSNLVESWRRGATYADKLLRGAKPAELPIHQPTKFELVINARTAKLLGVTLPPSVVG